MPFQHDSLLIKSAYFPSSTYLLNYGGESSSGVWTSSLNIFKFEESNDVSSTHPSFHQLKSLDDGSISLKKDAHKLFCHAGNIYLFGGSDNKFYSPRNEIYMLQVVEKDGEAATLKWVELEVIGEKPKGRRLFGLQIVNGVLYVCGGRTAEYKKTEVFSDTWAFSLEKNQWERLDNLPIALCGVSLHHDKKKNRLLCFGGVTERGVYSNEIYEHNFTSRQWKRVMVPRSGDDTLRPSARERHSAIVDTDTNSIYMVGGWGEGGCKNDLWQFNMDTDLWTHITDNAHDVSKRYGHTSFIVGGKLFVCGGKTGSWKNIDTISSVDEAKVSNVEAAQYGSFYASDSPLPSVTWLDEFLGFKKPIEVSVSKKSLDDIEEIASPPQIVDQDVSLEITTPVNIIAERLDSTEKTSTLNLATRRTKRKRTRPSVAPRNPVTETMDTTPPSIDAVLAESTIKLPDSTDSSLKEESKVLVSETKASAGPRGGIPMMGMMNPNIMAEMAARRAKKS